MFISWRSYDVYIKSVQSVHIHWIRASSIIWLWKPLSILQLSNQSCWVDARVGSLGSTEYLPACDTKWPLQKKKKKIRPIRSSPGFNECHSIREALKELPPLVLIGFDMVSSYCWALACKQCWTCSLKCSITNCTLRRVSPWVKIIYARAWSVKKVKLISSKWPY